MLRSLSRQTLRRQIVPIRTILRKVSSDEGSQSSTPAGSSGDSGPSVTLNTSEFKLYNLESGPPTQVELTKAEAKWIFTEMTTIRRMEYACAELYREKVIRGFCHLYVGQEAICVGSKAVLRPQDEIITTYRCHGWAYIMGVGARGVILELAGVEEGCMRGKGGSMHIYAPKFYGGNGIVGGHVPLGTGAALALQYRGKDKGVVMCLYGDGAANQGQVFESYNLSCLWKLPIIYCCENNHFGMGTAENRASCEPAFYTRGHYIPGIWVDGMDVLAVRSAVNFSIEHVLNKGPIVLEFDTYRYFGHSMSDPGTSYRSRDEIKEVREQRDTLAKFKKVCIDNNFLTEDECSAIDKKAKDEMNVIKEDAKKGKEVPLKELSADVYLHNVEKKIRGPTGYNLDHFLTSKPFLPI